MLGWKLVKLGHCHCPLLPRPRHASIPAGIKSGGAQGARKPRQGVPYYTFLTCTNDDSFAPQPGLYFYFTLLPFSLHFTLFGIYRHHKMLLCAWCPCAPPCLAGAKRRGALLAPPSISFLFLSFRLSKPSSITGHRFPVGRRCGDMENTLAPPRFPTRTRYLR